MNNLHRELAPISDAAWSQIEEETSRTIKRYLAGRRVVDVQGPGGIALSAIGTGHLRNVAAPGDGILARQREVKPLVELRVPFELDRQQIDDVERGANDSDWQPAKDAARLLAFAEDRAIFEGYAAAGIGGIREGTSNPVLTLPARCARLSRRHCPRAQSIATRGRQRSLFSVAGRRCLYGFERDQRSRLSGAAAHQGPRGRRNHLGAGDQGRIRVDDARRRFRSVSRRGCVDRLSKSRRYKRSVSTFRRHLLSSC